MIKCLTGWVAILPEEIAISPKGIAYPENKRPVRSEGNVVAVGPRVEGINRGDRVLFGGRTGELMEIDGVKHIIIDHEAVFGVITLQSSNNKLQKASFPEWPKQHLKEEA